MTLYIVDENGQVTEDPEGGIILTPEEQHDAALDYIRATRNGLLLACDWTDAAPHLTRPQRKQWQIYRQALRDITEQDPALIEWPTPPDKLPEYNTYEWLTRLPLEEAQKWARAEVDLQAGERRTVYGGLDIPFQAAVYTWKQWEAQGDMPNQAVNPRRGFLNDPEPSPEKYPILYAEALGRGKTPQQVAEEYATNGILWPQIVAALETIRLGALDAITAAADHQAVIAIMTNLTWPV